MSVGTFRCVNCTKAGKLAELDEEKLRAGKAACPQCGSTRLTLYGKLDPDVAAARHLRAVPAPRDGSTAQPDVCAAETCPPPPVATSSATDSTFTPQDAHAAVDKMNMLCDAERACGDAFKLEAKALLILAESLRLHAAQLPGNVLTGALPLEAYVVTTLGSALEVDFPKHVNSVLEIQAFALAELARAKQTLSRAAYDRAETMRVLEGTMRKSAAALDAPSAAAPAPYAPHTWVSARCAVRGAATFARGKKPFTRLTDSELLRSIDLTMWSNEVDLVDNSRELATRKDFRQVVYFTPAPRSQGRAEEECIAGFSECLARGLFEPLPSPRGAFVLTERGAEAFIAASREMLDS